MPFFGICLGMQMAVVEFARHVCGLAGANSSEFDLQTPHPVIHLMAEQKAIDTKGGTMRLGAFPCVLQNETLSAKLYGREKISERHRHRYEFNNSYRAEFGAKGMVLSGLSPDSELVEIIELKNHPWFLGCQFHPEFKSRPMDSHPLFRGFIEAALQNRKAVLRSATDESRAYLIASVPHSLMSTKLIKVGNVEIGAGRPLAVIAGPCVIESKDSALRHAAALKEASGPRRRAVYFQIVL